jgi:hypothetical protein
VKVARSDRLGAGTTITMRSILLLAAGLVACSSEVDLGPNPDAGADTALPTPCTPGETRACYTGPPSTAGVGICKPGTQVCLDSRTFGECKGEVIPSPVPEACGTKEDLDCNGSLPPARCSGGIEWSTDFSPARFADIALDSAGNFFVVGTFEGPSLALGSLKLTAGTGSPTGFVAKLDPSAKPLWAKAITNGATQVIRVTVDGKGNAYTAVGLATDDGNGGYVMGLDVAKYDPAGARSWIRSYPQVNLLVGLGEDTTPIAVNANGDVVFCGTFVGTTKVGNQTFTSAREAQPDGLIVRLGPTGNLVWVHRLAATTDFEDASPAAVAIDAAGLTTVGGGFALQLTIGGKKVTGGKTSDGWVARVANDGTVAWVSTWGGADYDIANHLALDESGGFVTFGVGTPKVPFSFGGDPELVRWSQNGTKGFAKALGPHRIVTPVDVGVDKLGNTFISVRSDGKVGLGGVDVMQAGLALARYDAAGNFVWQAGYVGDLAEGDSIIRRGGRFALDPQGAIFLLTRGGREISKVTP